MDSNTFYRKLDEMLAVDSGSVEGSNEQPGILRLAGGSLLHRDGRPRVRGFPSGQGDHRRVDDLATLVEENQHV
jgi:hypothetical protein